MVDVSALFQKWQRVGAFLGFCQSAEGGKTMAFHAQRRCAALQPPGQAVCCEGRCILRPIEEILDML